ncbi:MAG TPA: 16S rRNA (cytidine(1402)-2'-O)-methyltransferase [Pyrinomonadaceae bacterium]|nr:16S rRNA (cytidine(1402)-2'-O)-methyltransferase [Pyrinomonadaceae bacterium]
MTGILYLVATPIGNLQDISFRAVETLKAVDLIACEDTRHTRKLLNAFDISNKLVSYHEHNEHDRVEEFGKLLADGRSIAIVSDAGTPGINDPGFRLVQKAIETGVKVVPIPGAVAFVNAVIASGLPTDSIFFGGFLPSKTGERKKRLTELKDIPATLVFYETPHRLLKAIADCVQVFGNRKAAVARELTKLHEEIVTMDLQDLENHFSKAEVRGEIVLVIERGSGEAAEKPRNKSLSERFDELVAEGVDHRLALKAAAKEFGLSKSEAYRIVQTGKS